MLGERIDRGERFVALRVLPVGYEFIVVQKYPFTNELDLACRKLPNDHRSIEGERRLATARAGVEVGT
jgi:hypothetical protein